MIASLPIPAWLKCNRLFGIVDPVVEGLRPPQGVGVVELQQVDPRTRVLVRAGVDLLVAVPPVDGHDHRRGRALVRQRRRRRAAGFRIPVLLC